MPVIKLNKKRVLKFVGKKFSDNKLKDRIAYLGTDLEEITKDEIIVEIFPNRPDLLSEEGFARALASFTGTKKELIKYKSNKSKYVVKIKKDVKLVRPFTACAVIKNLKLDEDKIQDIINIQEKLHITYGRDRKRCAIGVYPMELIEWPITYTALAPKDIDFIPLEETKHMNGLQILQKHEKGRKYAHLLEGCSKFPVFMDAKKEVLSMPPIINSEKTGKISNKTKEIFLECSGHNFVVLSKAVNMIVTALADMGGTIYDVKLEFEGEKSQITPNLKPEIMILDTKYVHKYLGINLTTKQIMGCLKKMGFDSNKEKNKLKVLIPCYRTDILHQIDLVEDVAIGYGFDNIVENTKRVPSTGKEIFSDKIKRRIREILSGVGLIETCNYSLVPLKEQEMFIKENEEIVKIKNSISSEFNSLRRKNMYSSLKTLKNNKMNEYPQNIFEIGIIFKNNKEEETLVEEIESLSVLLCSDSTDFTKAKQILDLIFDAFNIEYSLSKKNYSYYIDGRSGEIKFNKKLIGHIGEISPKTLELFDLTVPAVGFEIELKEIFEYLELKK